MPQKQRNYSDNTPRNPVNEIEIARRRTRRACSGHPDGNERGRLSRPPRAHPECISRRRHHRHARPHHRQKLTEIWGQNVVIENRPGGGGNIGAAAAAQSAPDGYTIHFGAQSLAVNVTLLPSKDFDPVADFDPIILVGTAQDVLPSASW
jgi:hypothetical protein